MVEIGSKEYVKLVDEAYRLLLDDDFPGEPKITRNVSAVVLTWLPGRAAYITLEKSGINPDENLKLKDKIALALEARVRRLGQRALIDAKEHDYDKKIQSLPPEPLYLDPEG